LVFKTSKITKHQKHLKDRFSPDNSVQTIHSYFSNSNAHDTYISQLQ